jgi:DNA-binding NarL/FixJ family response regulator
MGAMTDVDHALVAVVDGSGTVYDVVRQACPDVPMRKFGHRGLPANGSRPALAIFAIYGPEDWRRLEGCARSIRTVAVSTTDDGLDASRAWSAGAFGLLHTQLPRQAVRRAILGALNGQPAYSRAALGERIRAELTAISGRRVRELTPRQREIGALIAKGASDREIAAHLGITPATAQKHVQGLLRRLGVPNRAAAVAALMS